MNRKQLADEIRHAGLGWRFADGPIFVSRASDSEDKPRKGPGGKFIASDRMILRLAATCSDCERVASVADIEFATESADNYQSYARLIWPCIHHHPWCGAEPYLPVSEVAKKLIKEAQATRESEATQEEEEAEKLAKKPAKKAAKKKPQQDERE